MDQCCGKGNQLHSLLFALLSFLLSAPTAVTNRKEGFSACKKRICKEVTQKRTEAIRLKIIIENP